MQITRIANEETALSPTDLAHAIKVYEERDQRRRQAWTAHFAK